MEEIPEKHNCFSDVAIANSEANRVRNTHYTSHAYSTMRELLVQGTSARPSAYYPHHLYTYMS